MMNWPEKEVEVLVPQERLEAHRRQRRQYQEKPEARVMGAGRDLSGRRRDGTEFPVEIGLSPIGRQGRHAVLATVIDITGRKRPRTCSASSCGSCSIA